jgi:hypothetical protein
MPMRTPSVGRRKRLRLISLVLSSGSASTNVQTQLPSCERQESTRWGSTGTEYSVVFAVVALPLTYLPILMLAGDRSFMGEHAKQEDLGHAGLVLLRGHCHFGHSCRPTAVDDERRRRVSKEGETEPRRTEDR